MVSICCVQLPYPTARPRPTLRLSPSLPLTPAPTLHVTAGVQCIHNGYPNAEYTVWFTEYGHSETVSWRDIQDPGPRDERSLPRDRPSPPSERGAGDRDRCSPGRQPHEDRSLPYDRPSPPREREAWMTDGPSRESDGPSRLPAPQPPQQPPGPVAAPTPTINPMAAQRAQAKKGGGWRSRVRGVKAV